MSERIDYGAAAPEGYKAFLAVYGAMQKCSLPRELVNLVYLRVSLINGCAYCIDLHSRDLLQGGMPPEKLALAPVWREADALFNEQERAALAWAERLTHVAREGVPDADYQAVTAVFNDRDVADLTYAVCLMNGMNRLAISFRKTPAAVQAAR
ncbi:carboxymuconolactone decarboxylase family protein [Bordetella petrii]|uniref:carboxymuconolactone decarboxylase family protein n=1 Tax=Bordetella petrii TaxID=94624 RepID=UPI001E424A7D|nr:carboxymuconolactone decarboxylase family protein [Bordetella petrii]MCD0502864.1 carboxymuconolactone decarboxylase family protein [Bordetella petrii]